MSMTPLAGPIQSCPRPSRRQEATRRAAARANHPTEARYSSRPRRAVAGSMTDRWDPAPRLHHATTDRFTGRLRYVSAARIIQGLMATGGWDPAFLVARRRYLRRHPEG